MKIHKMLIFLLTVIPYTYSTGQVLNFNLSLEDGIYKGTVDPDYFDSLIIYPSNDPQNPLLNSNGVLFNSEHGNFEFGIVENTIDNASNLLIKLSFGWFPLTTITSKNDLLEFSWDWDYRPTPNQLDVDILKHANKLLKDESSWNKTDDRECGDDNQKKKWSLYCALYTASLEVLGDFNHRNSAMEMVRITIEEITPNREYGHRLMDFNNHNSFKEIKLLLNKSTEKLETILANN